MTPADFKNVLVLEDNGKQNPNEFYTKKYINILFAVMVKN